MLIKKSFYFVRHGETAYNAQGLCMGGSSDIPLNKKGLVQAAKLHEKISQITFDRLVASPLARAMQTATLSTKQIPEVERDLREWEFGVLEGATIATFVEHIATITHEDSLPAGESRRFFYQRSIKAVNTILEDAKKPLIVAHGGTYWAILDALQKEHHNINNAELVHFRCEQDQWVIEKI